MPFSTHKRNSPLKNPLWVVQTKKLYVMYVSLRRYDFVAKVINYGRGEVKNSLVRK